MLNFFAHYFLTTWNVRLASRLIRNTAFNIWLWNLIDHSSDCDVLWESQIEGLGLNPGDVDANELLCVLHSIRKPSNLFPLFSVIVGSIAYVLVANYILSAMGV